MNISVAVVICIKAPSFVDSSVDDPWSPPDLYTTTTTSPVYAIFGKEVHLNCSLPRSRPASVTWVDFVYNSDRDPASIFGEDRRLNEDHPNRENYQVDSDFRLTISHLAFEDAGEYRCLSRTTEGLQHSISYYLAIIGKLYANDSWEIVITIITLKHRKGPTLEFTLFCLINNYEIFNCVPCFLYII